MKEELDQAALFSLSKNEDFHLTPSSQIKSQVHWCVFIFSVLSEKGTPLGLTSQLLYLNVWFPKSNERPSFKIQGRYLLKDTIWCCSLDCTCIWKIHMNTHTYAQKHSCVHAHIIEKDFLGTMTETQVSFLQCNQGFLLRLMLSHVLRNSSLDRKQVAKSLTYAECLIC